MMKTRRTTIWVAALTISFVAIFSSCSDEFFNTEQGGRIDPNLHYKSYIDAIESYAGCFTFLQEIAEKQIIVDGLRSDLMDVTGNADIDMIAINMHELSADNSYLDPAAYYKLIININETLPNLPQIIEIDRDFDEVELETMEGNLITLRSWAYFMLAKLNGEVGLLPEGGEVDITASPVYLSKDEIIDQLIQELLVFDDPSDNMRFDLDHYVLLGELYLEKGDYANAAKYLKFAVDGSFFRKLFMVDNSYDKESWQDIFLNAQDQGSTVRTAVPYSFTDGQRNMLEEWMSIDFNYMVKPTATLLDSFDVQIQQNNDTADVYRSYGITVDTTAAGDAYIKKYTIDEGIPHSADVVLYRASDIHLMLAEALNRNGDHDLALVLLNKGFKSMGAARPSSFIKWSSNLGVRGRVYLDEKEVPPSDTANPTEYIEDLIIQERAMELAFEGKRFFDLVRVATRRNDPAFLADKVSAKFEDAAEAEAIRQKLMDPANWYLPIPKVEE